jgi:hypothetical protein
MYYLRYLCLFSYSGAQHILYCVFVLLIFLCTSMLPVSLDCPCLIAPSVFSNIYLVCQLIRIIHLSHSTPDPNP